jgi:hypothetical protein
LNPQTAIIQLERGKCSIAKENTSKSPFIIDSWVLNHPSIPQEDGPKYPLSQPS